MATMMPSVTEPSGYVLEPLREGADFTLYRGRQHGNPSPVLAVALAAEQPSPQGLRRLEHEYSLAAELDPAWAARPLALTRHKGRTILVLTDPGGEPLDRILERHQGQPLSLTRILRIAIGLATALGQVHRHGLIQYQLGVIKHGERGTDRGRGITGQAGAPARGVAVRRGPVSRGL